MFPDRYFTGELRPYADAYGPTCAEAMLAMLADAGLEVITLASVAKGIPMTPGGLHRALGGRAGVVAIGIEFAAQRWMRRLDAGIYEKRLPWIPRAPEEIDLARAWSALSELAEGEARSGRPAAAQWVARAVDHERSLVAHLLGDRWARTPSDAEVTTVVALATGLRSLVCAGSAAVPCEDAYALLAEIVGPGSAPGTHAARPSARAA